MLKYLAAGAFVAALVSANPAVAQATASASVSGTTTIIQPVTVTKTNDLVFGRVVRPASGSGTVTIPYGTDTVTATGGAVAIAGIATSHAKFTVAGEGGQTVSVTVPASFSLTGPGDAIDVTLTGDKTGSQALGGTLGSSSSIVVNVGGSFALAAEQKTGAYTGSFTVSAAYN